MLQLNNYIDTASIQVFFKNEGVVAFTSGASVDFTPVDFDSPLTEVQRAYLYKNCGVDIPQVFWRKQVHGDNILVADKSYVIPAPDDQLGVSGMRTKNIRGQAPAGIHEYKNYPDADAFITNEKNLPIAIRTADCVPIFIFDPLRRVIGLVHAGWKGTTKEIAAKTVKKMKEKFDSQPSYLKVVLGPSIRKCCYQVGKEFHEYLPAYVNVRDGFLYADLISANRDQLLQTGVTQKNIVDSGICACCNKNYFSYRRDGEDAGRMISLMMLT